VTNHHQVLVAALALSVAGSVIVADDARASDRKTYQPSACQATDGNNANYNRSPYRITKSGGSGMGHLLCPMVHDSFDTGGDDFFLRINSLEVEVSVMDWHSQSDVSCTLFIQRNNGGVYSWSTKKTTGMKFETLKLGPGGIKPSEKSSYVLQCDMPTNDANGYTKIFGYTVLEKKS